MQGRERTETRERNVNNASWQILCKQKQLITVRHHLFKKREIRSKPELFSLHPWSWPALLASAA